MNYRRSEIVRSHHGLVPIRYAHCDNQARILGTLHVVKLYGHTYDGWLYGNVRLYSRYGDPNNLAPGDPSHLTYFKHSQLSPLWLRKAVSA